MPDIVGKIERKYMAHYINTGTTSSPSWYWLGDDLEDYSIELNPDTELFKNIKGVTEFRQNGYEPSASSDPFYARQGDALFAKLQKFVDERPTGDQNRMQTLEVHLWEEGSTSGSYVAWRQDAYVVPSSYGGDTSGYQIPFDINYVGDRTKGMFAVSGGSGTFTPDETSALG